MVSNPDIDHAALREQLRRVMRRICPAWLSGEMEDLVQAAQLKILRRASAGPLETAYLYRVGHSVMVDEIRRRKRRPEVPVDPVDGPQHPDERVGPETRAVGMELGIAIHACLSELKPHQRRAVTLHLQGHSVPEIGELLGFNRKKAENLVYRGLADLRERLRKRGLEP